MFFTYKQNNTFGEWVTNNKLTHFVIIEADNARKANKKAQKLGIYFDGVDDAIDCPCCGNRWDRCNGDSATEEPEIYGMEAQRYANSRQYFCGDKEICGIYIYYEDGRIDKLKKEEQLN